LQQPWEQELALHTQLPEPSQVWPEGQARHIAPPLPQELPDCEAKASHDPVGPPLQQPIAQDVASQTHCPPLHSRPVPQLLQTEPPEPHCKFVGLVMQCCVAGSQQPMHVVGLQMHCPAVLQVWSEEHAWHATPLTPQAVLDDVMQLPLEQQPAHVPPPQVQAPFEQL
jgi:hypothetical protein